MINLRRAKRFTVIGGGTAGWFAALTLRSMFSYPIEIMVIEAPEIGIIGVGEGGVLNLMGALRRLQIPLDEFAKETGAAYKLGFAYEGWRTGKEDDCFYHMFSNDSTEELLWLKHGFYPILSNFIHKGVDLHRYMKGFDVLLQQGSQADAAKMLAEPANGIAQSLHFDSHRVAKYLQRVATGRGVIHKQTKVQDLILNEIGHVTAIQTTDERIQTDFVIDASGFARLGIGKKFKGEWTSFKEYLLLDRAIPFHMPHPKKEPYLVTRALAMNAGWMWQIPLLERVGAGYVFSSKHIDEDTVLREIEQKVGCQVEPMRTLSFEPGHFNRVWQGNVMAIGLASGFVEPLEATSIGQMLEQLRNFGRIVSESNGVISERVINDFNEANVRFWAEIRDFLRMHYDCPRRDTPFWQDIAKLPLPETYAALKECMTQRTPRQVDIMGAYIHGWKGMFNVVSWMRVAAPLGLISKEYAGVELLSLPKEDKQRLAEYMQRNWPSHA